MRVRFMLAPSAGGPRGTEEDAWVERSLSYAALVISSDIIHGADRCTIAQNAGPLDIDEGDPESSVTTCLNALRRLGLPESTLFAVEDLIDVGIIVPSVYICKFYLA
jgi:hypothetical protein